MKGQLKWDNRFLDLAFLVSKWSKDPSTQAGAVIVRDRKVLGLGYNGFPRGVIDTDTRLMDRAEKLKRMVHAEWNAVLNAGQSVQGATIYVWPLFACGDCAKVIIQSGIRRVVCGEIVERFRESNEVAQEMFLEAGVEWVQYEREADPEGGPTGSP